MYNSISETVKLANGVEMPRFGLGVWMAEDPDELVNAIKYAVKIGYRSIDTAAQYGNEEATGRGMRTQTRRNFPYYKAAQLRSEI